MKTLRIWLTLAAIALIAAMPMLAQSTATPEAQLGNIVGTVTDANNSTVSGATVVLQGPTPSDRRTVVTKDNGFFEFQDVTPKIPYQISIKAQGFAEWTAPVALEPGKSTILNSKLLIEQVRTTVNVTPAAEQVEEQLHQRVLGVIPNFYVVYDQNAAPLTPSLKFKLAWRVTYDPVTIIGVALIAGIKQAADTPDYRQGAYGYAQRLGAEAAGGFADIMIGGAILPSLLHQDPRYFYKGTGTKKSRVLYALATPFICKGDNGKWQPNISSIGGDLTSAAIANAYLPESNRGVGATFGNFAIFTAERAGAALVQEFILRKLTKRPGKRK